MKNEKKNDRLLVKVSTYAKMHGISVPAVHKRIAVGSVKCVEIDGVKFIEIGDEDRN